MRLLSGKEDETLLETANSFRHNYHACTSSTTKGKSVAKNIIYLAEQFQSCNGFVIYATLN